MSSPSPGVSPVPFNSTPPPPVSNLTPPPPPGTTNQTASQAPPLTNSNGTLTPPSYPSGSPGPAGPSPPVLSALIVGVVLGVLAGVGFSVCVYRRKKRKEAQRLLLAGQPSQVASKGLFWFLLTLNCIQCAFVLGFLICFVSCCVLYAVRFQSIALYNFVYGFVWFRA
jgi:hypothetical protein